MSGTDFTKMHGLGNDFVIVDARRTPYRPEPAAVRALADRRRGIGFDQLIVLRADEEAGTDGFFAIYNADGGEVEACGNATRCVAGLLMAELGRPTVSLMTKAGRLEATDAGDGRVSVDMGEPDFDWRSIPLSGPADTDRLELAAGPLSGPSAVSMGNPHAVFVVDDCEAVDLAALGPTLEHDALFPERANIGVASVRASDRLRLRVWERGAGLTQACGTGACAAAVVAARRGLTGRRVEVVLDGGPLDIEWREDNRVIMTGPFALSFTGRIPG